MALFFRIFLALSIALSCAHAHAVPQPINPALIQPNTTYFAAGLIPLAKDANGTRYVLLAVDSGNVATDFGGLKEESLDHNNPYFTAAREACEESMYILDSNTHFERLLQLRNRFGHKFDAPKAHATTYNLFINAQSIYEVPSKCGNYFTYIVHIPFDKNMPSFFKSRLHSPHQHCVPWCWQEKKELAWVRVEALMQEIATAPTEHSVFIKRNHDQLHISHYVVQTLKKAQSLGIFATL